MDPNVRPEPLWTADVSGLVEHLRCPHISSLTQAGSLLVQGWIAA